VRETLKNFEEIISLFYDVLVLARTCLCPTTRSGPKYCFGLWGKRGVNPSHVVRNFFLLKLIILVKPLLGRTHDQILSHKSDCYVLRNLGAGGSRQIQAQVTLQLTVSQLVCLGVEPLMGLMTRMHVMSSLLQY
jgi:hypothetical protein